MPKNRVPRGSGNSRKKAAAKKKTPAQEALEVTWALKGNLKSAQIAYLLSSFLSKLRRLRRAGARLKDMPAEALSKMDSAIEVMENAMAFQKGGVGLAGAA